MGELLENFSDQCAIVWDPRKKRVTAHKLTIHDRQGNYGVEIGEQTRFPTGIEYIDRVDIITWRMLVFFLHHFFGFTEIKNGRKLVARKKFKFEE